MNMTHICMSGENLEGFRDPILAELRQLNATANAILIVLNQIAANTAPKPVTGVVVEHDQPMQHV